MSNKFLNQKSNSGGSALADVGVADVKGLAGTLSSKLSKTDPLSQTMAGGLDMGNNPVKSTHIAVNDDELTNKLYVTGAIIAANSNVAILTTGDVPETTNLYYTDGRVDNRLAMTKAQSEWNKADIVTVAAVANTNTTDVAAVNLRVDGLDASQITQDTAATAVSLRVDGLDASQITQDTAIGALESKLDALDTASSTLPAVILLHPEAGGVVTDEVLESGVITTAENVYTVTSNETSSDSGVVGAFISKHYGVGTIYPWRSNDGSYSITTGGPVGSLAYIEIAMATPIDITGYHLDSVIGGANSAASWVIFTKSVGDVSYVNHGFTYDNGGYTHTMALSAVEKFRITFNTVNTALSISSIYVRTFKLLGVSVGFGGTVASAVAGLITKTDNMEAVDVEQDTRLDDLEAKDVFHDGQITSLTSTKANRQGDMLYNTVISTSGAETAPTANFFGVLVDPAIGNSPTKWIQMKNSTKDKFVVDSMGSMLLANGGVDISPTCFCVLGSDAYNLKTNGNSQIAINRTGGINQFQIQGDLMITPTKIDMNTRDLVVKGVTQDVSRSAYAQLRRFNPSALSQIYEISDTNLWRPFTDFTIASNWNALTNLVIGGESNITIKDAGTYKVSITANMYGDKNGPFCLNVRKTNTGGTTSISCPYVGNISSLDLEASDVFLHEFAVNDVLTFRVGRETAGGGIVKVQFRTITVSIEKLCKNAGGNDTDNTVAPPIISMSANTFTEITGITRVVTASSTYIQAVNPQPYKAFDNNTSTYWASDATSAQLTYTSGVTGSYYSGTTSTTIDGIATTGEWISIDFGITYRISSYTVDPSPFRSCPNQWVLAVSNNGSTWTQVDAQHLNPADTSLSGIPTSIPLITLSTPVDARYARLVIRRVFVDTSLAPGTGATCMGLRFF